MSMHPSGIPAARTRGRALSALWQVESDWGWRDIWHVRGAVFASTRRMPRKPKRCA